EELADDAFVNKRKRAIVNDKQNNQEVQNIITNNLQAESSNATKPTKQKKETRSFTSI
ncbi:6572_t:CDS:1, partial [Dentiscutata heterogama]